MCSKKYRLGRKRVYLPTTDDIKKACDRIREDWTTLEYRKRSGYVGTVRGDFLPWTPPVVSAQFVRLFLSEEEELG